MRNTSMRLHLFRPLTASPDPGSSRLSVTGRTLPLVDRPFTDASPVTACMAFNEVYLCKR